MQIFWEPPQSLRDEALRWISCIVFSLQLEKPLGMNPSPAARLDLPPTPLREAASFALLIANPQPHPPSPHKTTHANEGPGAEQPGARARFARLVCVGCGAGPGWTPHGH